MYYIKWNVLEVSTKFKEFMYIGCFIPPLRILISLKESCGKKVNRGLSWNYFQIRIGQNQFLNFICNFDAYLLLVNVTRLEVPQSWMTLTFLRLIRSSWKLLLTRIYSCTTHNRFLKKSLFYNVFNELFRKLLHMILRFSSVTRHSYNVTMKQQFSYTYKGTFI